MRNASVALGAHSRYVMLLFLSTLKPIFSVLLKVVSILAPTWKESLLTRLNFSKPPSVWLILAIQSCALLYRFRRASLKGASQGSSCTTPARNKQSSIGLHVTYQCHHLGDLEQDPHS